MILRYAIWAAVSTEAQAASDKVSLSEQESLCRQAAAARGWRETAGPYIVPGESRTRWVNLRDAEQAIPALRQLLDAAQHGQFDLLILYDYNRLRDLLDPVAKTLGHYGVQIFSVSQPVEPLPPGQYNPYASDTSNIMQGMSKIISQAQVADLRRKYKFAMPRRVTERGLPVQIPYGYRKPPGRETDRTAIPVIDPHRAGILIQARDLLLSGKSLLQIANHLNQIGELPPRGKRWYPQTIRGMLANPFYVGIVRWGITRNHLDPRTGRHTRDRSKAQAARMITGAGLHTPLWDQASYQQIMTELERRVRQYPGKRINQLSSLLNCGECGARMWAYYNGVGESTPENRIWRCSTRQPHVTIMHLEALDKIASELQKSLAANPANSPQELTQPDYQAQLDELRTRRQRLADAYLAGLFTLQDFSNRSAILDAEITKLEQRLADAQIGESERTLRQATRLGLLATLDRIPDYLHSGDPGEINRLLATLLDGITITPTKEVHLHYK